MENNSSKQVILSVVGIAILVVAVIGVSFAFFNYSRTGGSNNVINTGTVSFVFQDGDTINLSNHFPIATGAGLALANTEGDNDNVCTFTVTGYSSANTINYSVYAVPGLTQDKDRFKNSEVFLNIKATTPADGATFTPTAKYAGANAAAIGNNDKDGEGNSTDAIDTTGLLLGTGTITSTASRTTSFEVRMWVDSSVVQVGDGKTYTTAQYGNLYYSMKIKVVVD